MVIFYKKFEKYNETQFTKNKIGLKYSKTDKSCTLFRDNYRNWNSSLTT